MSSNIPGVSWQVWQIYDHLLVWGDRVAQVVSRGNEFDIYINDKAYLRRIIRLVPKE